MMYVYLYTELITCYEFGGEFIGLCGGFLKVSNS